MNRWMNVNTNVEYVSLAVVIRNENVKMNDVNVDYSNCLLDDNEMELDDDLHHHYLN